MEQVERLAAYLAGELSADERAAFERALERDPNLQAQLDAMRRSDEALASFPPPEPPDGFDARIDQTISAVLADTLHGAHGAEAAGDNTEPGTEVVDPTAGTDPSAAPSSDRPTHLSALPPPSGQPDPDAPNDELAARREQRQPRKGVMRALPAVAAGVALLAGVAIVGQTTDLLGGGGPSGDIQDSATPDAMLEGESGDDTEAEDTETGDAETLEEDAASDEIDDAAEDDAAEDDAAHDASSGADDAADEPADAPHVSGDDPDTDEDADSDPTPQMTRSHNRDEGPMVLADSGTMDLADLNDRLDHPAFEIWDGVNIGEGHNYGQALADWPQGYDVELSATQAANVAGCFDQYVTATPAAIVTFVEVATYDGQDAVVFGLLSPDDDHYVYRDVIAATADSCELLDYTRDY